ncbi:g5898 [Coccomyxa viridis]|uniref:G5898 protein n=1 Tax=Coccomyxa viridis TaxID=1274662 RepID=A0ABP1FU13_9CHLO
MAPKSQVPTHTVPSQLVWQLVKNYNCFLHKGLNGSQFSAERGNLYNVNSYKYSGLANEKTLHIEAGDENISVTRSHPKHVNRPAQHKGQANKKGKNFRNTSRKLSKDVSTYRPDLKKAALARASAVNKSQRTTAAASTA